MRSTSVAKITLLVSCLLLMPLQYAVGQDLEPRRWTPLPIGMNVLGAGYAFTTGDVFFDPVLQIEDTEVDSHTVAATYVRAFAIANKQARLDVIVPWQNKHWSGLLDGVPATATRVGMADPAVRLSIILAGASASGDSQRKSASSNTVFGAAVAVSLPLGEYFGDKLLNLGRNRVVIRPQIGVLHTRGQWSYELTGSTFFYSDNDEFYGGLKLEQDPLYAMQGHVVRVFDKPGYWAALSAGFVWSGESTINGSPKDDEWRQFLSALSVGVPVGMNQAIKFTYLRSRTNTSKGANTDSLIIGWSYRF